MVTTKKLFYWTLSITHSLDLMAMQHLDKQDLLELKLRIQYIESVRSQGPWRFGSIEIMNNHIASQIIIIKDILNKYSIDYLREKLGSWLESLKEQLNSTQHAIDTLRAHNAAI